MYPSMGIAGSAISLAAILSDWWSTRDLLNDTELLFKPVMPVGRP
jgi:hypothetical protein